MADDPTQALREPGLTDEDRRWLQTNLALTGACAPPAPPAPPPVPLRHPWTPDDDDITRCLLCDDPETAVRHWSKELAP